MWNPKLTWVAVLLLASSTTTAIPAGAMPDFLEEFKLEYPFVVGTKLDSCDVCHGANFPRRNPYGVDYNVVGRRFPPIEPFDSDDDGFSNLTEIEALTFPGDASDYPCQGDCNGDRVVTINELILAVNIALDLANLDQCPAADGNGDGQVTVNEVVTAVNLGLTGCP